MDQTVMTIRQPRLFAKVYVDLFNKRIRVDDYRGNVEDLITWIEQAGKERGIEKLIVKLRWEHHAIALAKGFVLEAIVPGYYHGSDMFFFSKFLRSDRRSSDLWTKEDEIVASVISDGTPPMKKEINGVIRRATKSDAYNLSSLYKEVFQIYPVPLHDSSYIEKSIDQGTIFYCIEINNTIISAASAEVNQTYKNAELTDCATLPSYRKGGLMKELLFSLEQELKNKQIFCVYTIARSLSYGMNAAFSQLGYTYGGRLGNNCYIYDKLEDMNVWYKHLGGAKN
jgi:beta-lysine N6-acetyltransferase